LSGHGVLGGDFPRRFAKEFLKFGASGCFAGGHTCCEELIKDERFVKKRVAIGTAKQFSIILQLKSIRYN
jgi:hypothetical protein